MTSSQSRTHLTTKKVCHQQRETPWEGEEKKGRERIEDESWRREKRNER